MINRLLFYIRVVTRYPFTGGSAHEL